jgi:hypothetical protein
VNADVTAIERAAEQTRAALRSFWYPLVVIGALTLGAGALYAFAPSGVVGTYWIVGYAAALLLSYRYYAVRAQRVGVAADERPSLAVWVGFVVATSVAATIASRGGGNLAVSLSAFAVIALLSVWLARRQHSILLTAVGGAIAGFGVLVALADPAHAEAIWCFGVGAILTASGLYAREHDAAP